MLTINQLEYLERKRKALYDVRSTLRQYRVKRSKSLTCAIDEVNSQLKFYDEWYDALTYGCMDSESRRMRMQREDAYSEMAKKLESAFWGKFKDIEQQFGLSYHIAQEAGK